MKLPFHTEKMVQDSAVLTKVHVMYIVMSHLTLAEARATKVALLHAFKKAAIT